MSATRTSLAAFLLICAAGATVSAQDVSWQLIRPSNTGVPGDYTQNIFIDDDDSPWISGYVTFWEEGGVGHFDGTHWRTLNNVDCPIIGQEIGAPRFNDIVKTDDGIMWIGGSQGLMRFDPTDEPWCVTRYTPSNSGIAGAYVSNIDIAPDGTLWMACSTWGGSTQGGLSQYDPSTNTWNSWDTSNGLPWWAGWDWVDYVGVQPDAAGGYTVWFGSAEMGLTTYKDGLFIWYGSPTPPNVHPLPSRTLGEDPVADNGDMLVSTDQGIAFRHPDGTYSIVGSAPAGLGSEVSIIQQVSGGRVLLGTFGADVFLWDGSWTYLGNWGSGNHTYTLTEDSTGAFWAGGIGGASKYENGAWQRYRLTNTGFTSFFPEGVAHNPVNGDVAFAVNAGTGVGGFDLMHRDGTWTNANVATYGLGLPWDYPTDSTTNLAYRPNGNLLFAPRNNGLHEYTGKDYVALISDPYSIEHIAVSGNGRGWASTGRGLLFMEDADGQWDTTFSNADGLPVGDISDIVADPTDPDFVFVGAQFGIARTDGVTWEITPREAVGLDLDTLGYHIWAFDVAPDATLWIASGIGLFHYDPDTGLYDTYDLSNSPLPSDDIHDVEIAPDGSVWISMFDTTFPYPGGVARLKDGAWTVWTATSSPLPHNQIWDMESTPIVGGYEMWIATASEAVAVVTVETNATCPADLAEPQGQLDFSDVVAFLTAFGAMDPSADFATPTGQFDFSDVVAFLTAFGAGCP
ncbi:MAG: GC-type dockerin domain-anchored protein [Phycisphaerales bacterium]